MLDRLPPELLHYILDSIEPLDRIEREEAYARCSLVSKALYTAVVPLLWCDVAPFPICVPAFLDAARSKPALAGLVRTLAYEREVGAFSDFSSLFGRLEVIRWQGRRRGSLYEGWPLSAADWRSLASLPKLEALIFQDTEITPTWPTSLVFSSLTTLSFNHCSGDPYRFDHLLQPSIFPNLRALELLHSGWHSAWPVLSSPSPLLDTLDVLSLPLLTNGSIPATILSARTAILRTMSPSVDVRSDELDEVLASASIPHLGLTEIALSRDVHGSGYEVEEACRGITLWLTRPSTPPPLSLWLSPQLQDLLGSAAESVVALLSICREKRVKVGWLARRKDEAEDESAGAILDEGLRRYFRMLKEEREREET